MGSAAEKCDIVVFCDHAGSVARIRERFPDLEVIDITGGVPRRPAWGRALRRMDTQFAGRGGGGRAVGPADRHRPRRRPRRGASGAVAHHGPGGECRGDQRVRDRRHGRLCPQLPRELAHGTSRALVRATGRARWPGRPLRSSASAASPSGWRGSPWPWRCRSWPCAGPRHPAPSTASRSCIRSRAGVGGGPPGVGGAGDRRHPIRHKRRDVGASRSPGPIWSISPAVPWWTRRRCALRSMTAPLSAPRST